MLATYEVDDFVCHLIGHCIRHVALVDNGNYLEIVVYGHVKVADCLCLERIVGQEIFNISVLKERISDEKLEEALLAIDYRVTPYSINIGRVLPRCSPDYEIEFLEFDEAKNDMLSQAQVEAIEKSDDMIQFEKIQPEQRIDLFDASVFACVRYLNDLEKSQKARGWFDE